MLVKRLLLVLTSLTISFIMLPTSNLVGAQGATQPVADCGEARYFLGIPSWDRGLKSCTDVEIDDVVSADKSLNPVLIVILNLTEAVTRMAGLVALAFLIIGGFKYALSEGNPQKATEAQRTCINAMIGLVIAVLATVVINVVLRVFGV